MSTPQNKRGPRYLYNERSESVNSLKAEKARLEAEIKQLEKDDLFLEEQFLLNLTQLQEKLVEFSQS
ncbi:hypothetical protein M9Y10_021222 [Tritrichomonas musculus]|uniref:Uncharacterized protein n=1 Tax=Tritrichomonas musculus TaxID=1915356 RepID=A0ABR2HE99_9EUKA